MNSHNTHEDIDQNMYNIIREYLCSIYFDYELRLDLN